MRRNDHRLIWTNAVFKLLPTILIGAYLWLLNASNVAQVSGSVQYDILIFSGGMLLAFFLYAYKIRFSVSFFLLTAALFAAYRWISGSGGGEFDSFYWAMAFFRYSIVLIFGWLVGYGFARSNFFPWIAGLAVFLITVSLIVADFQGVQRHIESSLVQAVTNTVMPQNSLIHNLFSAIYTLFIPGFFYALYIVSINEILRKLTAFDHQKLRFLIRRSMMFVVITTLIMLLPLVYIHFFDIPEFIQDRIGQAQGSSADFLKKTYNENTSQPQFDLNDYAQLLPEIKLSDETVFCTYIDNFYPANDGSQIPLPVHFRRFVLNRYEPLTEKFVLDPYPPSAIPGDLFSPAIKDVPIGFSTSDSTILESTARYQYRRNISATVYNQTLDPNAYISPNTGYYYQKLPVAPEDRETFTTVYQCSSLISYWNLPPFMFSSNRPELVQFREQRAAALRQDKGYAGLDSVFMNYYTQLDASDSLIVNLSKELTAGKATPYDKVAAIVDYFTGVDDDGTRNFTYTLEPGSPSDPRQSFMHYFLFENKRGYCTYFAGATVLLLRAAGIPCRMSVGYAIYDRSNKNTGWYWVYADQGHAWLEVYFPTHGWVDFDTTPGDENEAITPPKPDATPPDYARDPVFAVIGQVTGISTDSSSVIVRPQTIRYRSKEYKITDEQARVISLKPADRSVKIDGQPVPIGKFDFGRTMLLSAYSFDYDLEKIRPYRGGKPFMEWFMQRFPEDIPVDEAIIVYQENEIPGGRVFAVEGRIQGISADSASIAVLPRKIFYKDRDYRIEPQKSRSIFLKPGSRTIEISGESVPLAQFTVGDSMIVNAESADPVLHALKPFLSTEPFMPWVLNTFPKEIPVDKVVLDLPQVPFVYTVLKVLLLTLVAILLLLLLLASLLHLYLSWRVSSAAPSAKVYWVYRKSLMMLNQLGFPRIGSTPREFAARAVDPKFDTEFARFMNIYLKSKYSPGPLSNAEQEFIDRFAEQFPEKVFSAYSRWDIMRDFTNFMRALRFMMVSN